MSNKSRSSTLPHFFILVACLALPASGQGVPRDARAASKLEEAKTDTETIKKLLKGIDDATSAKVVLANMSFNYIREPQGSHIPQGCTYTTKAPALIASLVSSIRENAQVKRGAWGTGGVKEYVSLEMANGEEVEFLFPGSGEYDRVPRPPGDPIEVLVIRTARGKRTEFLIGASSSVIHALYEWAVSVDPKRVCLYVTDYLKKQ